MNQILKIVNELQSTSSRKEKESILEQNKNNELWLDILKFVFNPYILTGLSTKKINKKIIGNICTSFPRENISDIINYLKENNTGKDVDIVFVQSFINKQQEELRELLAKIVTKDLSLGIDSKTINKVYNNIIPVFDVMLAHKYSDHEHKIKGDFILTEKLDGIRCILIKDENGMKFFSRQGQLIEGMVEIENEVVELPDGVYDGELILKNDNNLNSDDLYRATVKVVRKDGMKKNVEYHVFDYIPVGDFQNGICKYPCDVRKSLVSDYIGNNYKWIKEVSTLYKGDDKSVIPDLLAKVISKGKEGLMCNDANAPYECKRSDKILKIKKMHTVDLKIIGFEEGTGKYVGMLGRLNVDYKGYSVGVGSGFSDEDRTCIWNNQNSLLGKIIEVQYFEESKNQDGGISLRFPVFKRFRLDKDEVSYS